MYPRIIALSLLISTHLLMTGCVTMQAKVTPAGFDKTKKYTLVSITSNKIISDSFSTIMVPSVVDIARASGGDSGYTNESTKALNESVKHLRRQLSKTKAFKLQTAKITKRNSQLKNLSRAPVEIKKTFSKIKTITANGYKNLPDDKDNIIKLI